MRTPEHKKINGYGQYMSQLQKRYGTHGSNEDQQTSEEMDRRHKETSQKSYSEYGTWR